MEMQDRYKKYGFKMILIEVYWAMVIIYQVGISFITGDGGLGFLFAIFFATLGYGIFKLHTKIENWKDTHYFVFKIVKRRRRKW